MDNHTTESDSLKQFKGLMENNGIDGYILYMGDPHNSEYTGIHDKRISFISGFTGSAGRAFITTTEALLWTDGRYFTQANKELQDGWTLMKMNIPGVPTLLETLTTTSAQCIGIDGSTTTISEFNSITSSAPNKKFKIMQPSLVDIFMGSKQPDNWATTIKNHPLEFAGKDTISKLNELKKTMTKENADCLFISALDEIAWTLNMRANDVLNVPVFYAFLFISAEKVTLFVKESQLSEEAKSMLAQNKVEVTSYDKIIEFLKAHSEENLSAKIWMDPRTNASIYFSIKNPDTQVILKQSPIALMKCIKNEAEMNGMRKAHLKDSVALTKFFHWVEKSKEDESIFQYKEFELAQKLNAFRAEQEGFKHTSMGTISGNGFNSAIIHYRPSPTDSAQMHKAMYLVDSGGHYNEGSTDITRTTHLGQPTEFEKMCYTLVLKGHIALAKATFPQKTKGPQLDILARQFLWAYGLDFFHGTGHGVGAVLSLHEGPINISTFLGGPAAVTDLTPGMIVSNEPGFYDTEKKFGIRIENLLAVQKATTENNFGGISYNQFETLSLFPIDTSLINLDHMTPMEIDWLNNYHKEVYDKVSQTLKEQEVTNQTDYTYLIDWLKSKTVKIGS